MAILTSLSTVTENVYKEMYVQGIVEIFLYLLSKAQFALQVRSLPNNVSRSLRSPSKETNLITKIHSKYLRYLQYFKTLHRVFVYVIGWQAVAFGINSASIVYRKE